MLRIIKKILAVIVLIYCIWVIFGICTGAFGKPLTVSGIANRTKVVVEQIFVKTKRTINGWIR